MPVDRDNRKFFIQLLRELSMGIISNDDFEDLLPESDDLAIEGIAMHGTWLYYTDMQIENKAFEEAQKQEIRYWILFLESDLEYTWPEVSVGQRLLYWISFGRFGMSLKNTWESHGDIDTWPFLSKADLEKVSTKKDNFDKPVNR
mgnify:CR=1 FL=1